MLKSDINSFISSFEAQSDLKSLFEHLSAVNTNYLYTSKESQPSSCSFSSSDMSGQTSEKPFHE